MFVLTSSDPLDTNGIENPRLRALKEAWDGWREWREMPPLRRLEPLDLGANIGRVHLVEVLAHGGFRFLHYGAMVTNPDALDMSGRTTAEYRDEGFRALVEAHYGEVATGGRPVARHVIATVDGQRYEYVRLTLPFGEHGKVDFLLVGTQRIDVPGSLDREGPSPGQADALRLQAGRSRRLAEGIGDAHTQRALLAMGKACELRAAELDRMGAGTSFTHPVA